MKTQGDAFTRVQTPPLKTQKYLFHMALTNRYKVNTYYLKNAFVVTVWL